MNRKLITDYYLETEHEHEHEQNEIIIRSLSETSFIGRVKSFIE